MNDLAQNYLAQVEAKQLAKLKRYYQIAVSQTMQSAIISPHIEDPIVAQFLPQIEELEVSEHERDDPIGDNKYMPVEGLIHRYPNRVLWTVTPVCAVYCRFCFRKEMIGRKGRSMSLTQRDKAIDYIRAHPEIEEVILSGGDPLMLSNATLARLFELIGAIEHIKRIRIHTRIPIVKPERVDTSLCQLFAQHGEIEGKDNHGNKEIMMVIHANHWQEFSQESKLSLKALREADVMLFSQTVLLKGINDDVQVLATLMNTFLANHISPYYLHHLDLAKGTQHFRLSLNEGLALESALRKRLSGIAMPTYIVEIPGGDGKVPVHALSEEQRKQLNALGIY